MPDAYSPTCSIRPLKTRRKITVIGAAIAALAIGFTWQMREAILTDVAAWWVVSDELTHADAIAVLGGGIDVRPFAAADLYKRGFASTILVANVQMGRAEGLGLIPSHTELNREVLLKLGVPPTAIVGVGDNVSSTHDEAEAIREWALASKSKRIIVPTEIFASRRVQWIFDRELTPIGVQVIVDVFPPPEYTLADWWRHRSGMIDFNNEVLKYLYYRAKD
jgi:hypothetical protein